VHVYYMAIPSIHSTFHRHLLSGLWKQCHQYNHVAKLVGFPQFGENHHRLHSRHALRGFALLGPSLTAGSATTAVPRYLGDQNVGTEPESPGFSLYYDDLVYRPIFYLATVILYTDFGSPIRTNSSWNSYIFYLASGKICQRQNWESHAVPPRDTSGTCLYDAAVHLYSPDQPSLLILVWESIRLCSISYRSFLRLCC